MIRFLSVLLISLTLAACFPKKAGHRLAHFEHESPAEGAIAPDFKLKTPQGEEVNLNDLLGDKPIVLQLGSHTCPVYRYRRFSMTKLYRDYADKAHFLLVYTLEAHPADAINPYVDRKWVSSFNYVTNTLVNEHQNEEQRSAMAKYSHEALNLAYPMVVDNMNNEIWRAYGRAPSAAFVISPQGRIAARMPWVDPKQIASAIDEMLEQDLNF